MFKYFPFRYCKEYVCDCCLNEEEKIDKFITKQLKRMAAQSIYEGKIVLLGKNEVFINI